MRSCLQVALAAALVCHANGGAAKPACAQRILVAERRPRTSGPPPAAMPAELEWAYTRCGAVEKGEFFVDDTHGGKGMRITLTAERVRGFVESAKALAAAPFPATHGQQGQGWLAEAFRRNAASIANATVIVIGSMTPTVETLALAYGAAHVATVEYGSLVYPHPNLSTHAAAHLAAVFAAGGCGSGSEAASGGGLGPLPRIGAVVSLSSWDHDGLGRYGDPLAPDGDLMSVDDVARLSRLCAPAPLPLLFLSVPVGPDVVVWNLHRRYGRIRLPLLLTPFNLVDTVGWAEGDAPQGNTRPRRPEPPRPVGVPALDTAWPFVKSYEPLLVLRPVAADDGVEAGHAFEDLLVRQHVAPASAPNVAAGAPAAAVVPQRGEMHSQSKTAPPLPVRGHGAQPRREEL